MRGRLVLTVVTLASCFACTHQTSATDVPDPFTITDTFTAHSLGLKHIVALAVGPSDGNLYVADSSQQVAVISPDGELLRSWGSHGSGERQFRFDPNAGIAVGADGSVYVTDPGNHRITVFTSTGLFDREVGSFGEEEGQLLNPILPVVDLQGNLYVADDAIGEVTKFDAGGRQVWRDPVGELNQAPEGFAGAYPGGVDIHGRLVMMNYTGWVLYLDADTGHVLDRFQSGSCDVSIDMAGFTYTNKYEEDCSPGLTRIFDREHQLIGEWQGPDDVLQRAPSFGPNGEAFSLTSSGDIVRLQITLPET